MENQKHIEAYQDLFNYLHDEHDLILLQSEMDEIIDLSAKAVQKYNEASVGNESSSVPQANELLQSKYRALAVALEEAEKEIENLKHLAHEGLPDECVMGHDEVKFCPIRQGDGNMCKQCSNYG